MFTGAAAPFSADRAYPYITVGKLFFSINGAPYRLLGVGDPAPHRRHGRPLRAQRDLEGFHSNWVFVPAFRDGTAPLLAWNWTRRDRDR